MESNLHDWQSDRLMDYQKPKSHQKQEQFKKLPQNVNPHQKPKDKWVQEELSFNDKPWRETPLTDTEIENLFWRRLVVLGWRFQSYGKELDRKNIVLPCPYCNLVMDSHTILTESSAKKMQDKVYCEQVLKRHKGFECKTTEDDN